MTAPEPAEQLVAPSGLRATRTVPPVARGGVIFVPDAGGPDEAFHRATATLVAAGFVVVVPDLGWRNAPEDARLAPSDPEVIGDLGAARELLPPGARFVVGVGMGGLYARVAACAVLGLAGAVGFGGRISYSGVNARQPIQPLDLLPGLSCPLQCHFDADDPAAPAASVDELERRLGGTSKPFQIFRYAPSPGERADDVVARRTADARTAWGRACSFLLHLAADRT